MLSFERFHAKTYVSKTFLAVNICVVRGCPKPCQRWPHKVGRKLKHDVANIKIKLWTVGGVTVHDHGKLDCLKAFYKIFEIRLCLAASVQSIFI